MEPSWVSSRPLNSPGGAPPLWNVCYISRCCRCGPVRRQCQLVSAHSLVELAAGIIKLQTGFRPGVPPRGETARLSACQQLIRATLTPATRLHPDSASTHQQLHQHHLSQQLIPHITDNHINYPKSNQTSRQAHSTGVTEISVCSVSKDWQQGWRRAKGSHSHLAFIFMLSNCREKSQTQ